MEYAEAPARLREADPVLAVLIKANPDFDRRAWMKEFPRIDSFGTLVFQVIGQQLSMSATRSILDRLQKLFSGRLPTPKEFLTTPRDNLRKTGLSRRKTETLPTVGGALQTDTGRRRNSGPFPITRSKIYSPRSLG